VIIVNVAPSVVVSTEILLFIGLIVVDEAAETVSRYQFGTNPVTERDPIIMIVTMYGDMEVDFIIKLQLFD
jgi:hypothetical protein